VSSVHFIHVQFFWLPKLIHIKGCQDDNYTIADPNLPTQMNIEADALATKALQGGKSWPIIPFDPGTGAMLAMKSQDVLKLQSNATKTQHPSPATF
jgi:hypothetical protein